MILSPSPANLYTFKSFPYSSHDLILKMLAQEKSPQRILDVGAAGGYLGDALRKQGHYVVGVEKDADSARKAREYYDDFLCLDMETYPFSTHEPFDYLLFADVLEHMREPQEVVQRSLQALKPSGYVIISVPNIANLLIRLGLLFGHFDYAQRGILDRGHLRFFTLKSFRRMVENASLEILEVAATPLPFPLVFPATQHRIFLPFHRVHYALVRCFKTLLGYQLIIKARRRAF